MTLHSNRETQTTLEQLTISQFPDYETLSNKAAHDIVSVISGNPAAVICLATGATPTRTYELWCQFSKEHKQDTSQVRIVKLDEWGGLPPEHHSTCEYYLRKHVLNPLNIDNGRFISFRSDAEDPRSECDRIQNELNRVGAVDLCILGLGANGHLGFNEPDQLLQPFVHVANLAEKTQKHPMLEGSDVVPTYGMTLGMANILTSKRIMMLVNGQHKVTQLQKFLACQLETSFPASFLWLHSNVQLHTDVQL